MNENKTSITPLTNAERLRSHLSANGLAAALLAVWEADDPKNIQARLLAALDNFHNKNQTGNEKAKAE